jgi:hypothetical protein
LITHCLVQLNVQVLCNYTRGIWYYQMDILQSFLVISLSIGQGGKLCLELVCFDHGCWCFLLGFLY